MEKKVQQRTIENREKLLQVSLRQFSTKGFYNTNIRSITSEASLSTGVFYRYFDSKESLYIALIKEYFEESVKMLSQLHHIGLEYDSKDEARPILMQAMMRTIGRSTENSVLILDSMVLEKEIPELREVIIEGKNACIDCICDLLEKRYKDSDMDFRLTARMIFAATEAIGSDLSREQERTKAAKYLELFVEQILYYFYDLG